MKPMKKARMAIPQRRRLATLLSSSMRRLSRANRVGTSTSPMFLELSASNLAVAGDLIFAVADHAAPESTDDGAEEDMGEYALRIKSRMRPNGPSEKLVDG